MFSPDLYFLYIISQTDLEVFIQEKSLLIQVGLASFLLLCFAPL